MKHTISKLSDTKIKVVVSASSEDLAEAKQKTLTRLAKDVAAPGFRKGKVPVNVAEKQLDPNLLANEVTQEAINHTLNEIITVEELRVLDQPKIEITKFVPYSDMEYTAEIEVIPSIKLGNYKKLKASRSVKEVSKKDIDEVLERVKQNFAEKKEVKRAAKLDDEVTIDFVGKKDGEAFEGGTAKDYNIVLGSKTFIPGFEDAIVGHKVGDEFDVPLKFPKDYHAANLKGQAVVFSVKLSKITEVSLPELSDDLAKKVGPFESVKALTDDIKRELSAQNERQAENDYKDALVQALVKLSDVPVPEILIKDQLDGMEREAKNNLMYRGQTLEQYLEQQGYKDAAEWRDKELKESAIERVKAGLVLAELSKVENIEVSKDELDARQSEMIGQYPNMKEQLDAPEARADLVNRLVTEKTLERLADLNT